MEFIKNAASPSPSANGPAQAENRNCAVRIQSDTGVGFGAVFEQGATRFVVFDQRLIEGAESLTIWATTTNTSLRYEQLELAADRPLARFATDSTNILPLRVSPDGGRSAKRLLALSLVATNGQLTHNEIELTAQDTGTVSFSAAPENLLCVCDTLTNLVAIAQNAPGSRTAVKVAGGLQWIPAEPANFRKQTKLLLQGQAFAQASGTTDRTQRVNLRTALASTQWLTKHLRDRATALIQILDRPDQ